MGDGMKIGKLACNHLQNPLGYEFSHLTLEWNVTGLSVGDKVDVRIRIAKSAEALDLYSFDSIGMSSFESVRSESDSGDMLALEIESFEGARIVDDGNEVVFDSGVLGDYRECCYSLELSLESRCRYYWRVWIKRQVRDEVGSDTAWFETGKQDELWVGKWITAQDSEWMPILYHDFVTQKVVRRARLYLFGAGLYEAYLNRRKVGEEYLQPGYHSYDMLLEYQTYDVTDQVVTGANRLSVLLGEGWYKGRFGFDGEYRQLYGQERKCIGELVLSYEDGSQEVIGTDASWKGMISSIGSNGIYDGEYIDETVSTYELAVTECEGDTRLLTGRSNPPIHKVERFVPIREEWRSEGYLLLDFGESITGWVEWQGVLQAGQKITLSYGEILQNDAFYNENLRTAKAQFTYNASQISQGITMEIDREPRLLGIDESVRPHFTYYGFRYVKVEGLEEGQKLQFTAYRLMSDIQVTGRIVTSNEKVNRLFENTLRSQKCNFLDIPTDCPQRDERMGWTGDVAIFARTACFHMDCSAFFRHYMRSLSLEQQALEGAVPFFVPKPKIQPREGTNPFYISQGACAWGDVATVLPWTLYTYYGDQEMLREQFPSMCGWTDYITARAAVNPVAHLWQNDRQLGDWLALDNGCPENPIGKTDVHFLASAYYYQSAKLCSLAAEVLGDARLQEFYQLARDIKEAFIAFYYKKVQESLNILCQNNMSQVNISRDSMSQGNMLQGSISPGNMLQGSLSQGNMLQDSMSQDSVFQDNMPNRSNFEFTIEPTQTACAIALYLGLYPEGAKAYVTTKLRQLIEENEFHLNTGFIGTPILCPVLSENGMNDLAYGLLLNEEYPGWLYEVNLGATTIWERWNSLDPDGNISDTGMNSLNHYGYGSIADWMYRYMCGFRPSMHQDVKMTIHPMPDPRIPRAEGTWISPYGKYVSGWEYDEGGMLHYHVEIPFPANAKMIFENGSSKILSWGSYLFDADGKP
jgi:alpha-L-rhamnosidase